MRLHHSPDWIRSISLAAATILATGCSSIDKSVSKGYGAMEMSALPLGNLQEVLNNASKKMYQLEGSTPDHEGYKKFVSCVNGTNAETTECQQIRNTLSTTLVMASDQACNEHLKSMYGRDAGWNLGLGSLAALLSTSAAVASPAAAQNYAAASAFFIGERALTNEVVYKNQLIPVIHEKIQQQRSKLYDNLNAKFAKPIKEHPFGAALIDVSNYHYTCSFMLGLQLALKEGSTSSTELELASLRNRLLSAQADLTTVSQQVAMSGLSGAERAKREKILAAATDRVNGLLQRIAQLETGNR